MSNQQSRPPIVAVLLTVCFTGIMMFVLFGILSLADKTGGIARIVFSILNCLILMGLAALGGTIAGATTVATLIQLWTVTVLYTAAQFGAVFIGINTWNGNLYILYQLIVFFLYLCVALPVLSISYKKNKKNPTLEG